MLPLSLHFSPLTHQYSPLPFLGGIYSLLGEDIVGRASLQSFARMPIVHIYQQLSYLGTAYLTILGGISRGSWGKSILSFNTNQPLSLLTGMTDSQYTPSQVPTY